MIREDNPKSPVPSEPLQWAYGSHKQGHLHEGDGQGDDFMKDSCQQNRQRLFDHYVLRQLARKQRWTRNKGCFIKSITLATKVYLCSRRRKFDIKAFVFPSQAIKTIELIDRVDSMCRPRTSCYAEHILSPAPNDIWADHTWPSQFIIHVT